MRPPCGQIEFAAPAQADSRSPIAWEAAKWSPAFAGAAILFALKTCATSRRQFFERDPVVRIDADPSGDLHRAARHGLGIEPLDIDQRARRGKRVAAARADADNVVLGFED